jgi:peptide/nickel transport system substrate-binding protein
MKSDARPTSVNTTSNQAPTPHNKSQSPPRLITTIILTAIALPLFTAAHPLVAQDTSLPIFKPAPTDNALIDDTQTLHLSLRGNPNTLNPILSTATPDSRIKTVLFDYPFLYDHQLRWMTNDVLVRHYSEAPDHLSATLTLKPNLTWHDGQPFTVEDIIFTWKQILDPRVPAIGIRSGKDNITDCVVINDHTIQFTFAHARPTNKWDIMFGIIPKHLYADQKTLDPTLAESDHYNQLNRHPIGNGPYKFVRWIPDDKIILERWNDYPGPRPHFARIVFHIIPDAQTRLLAFQRNEIVETELTPQQFALETDTPAFKNVGVKINAPRWSFSYFVWNLDGSNPFFNDRRVRLAMSHAINYDLILRNALNNLYTRSTGMFSSTHPAHDPNIKPYKFDLPTAAKLLDRAGWIQNDRDGWRYKTNPTGQPTRFAFTMIIPRESQTAPIITAIIQQDLQRIGVQMKTQVIEWVSMLKLAADHEFQALYSGFTLGVDPGQAANILHSKSHSGGRNYGGYNSKRVDDLFQAASESFDHQQRMAHFAQISRIVHDDVPLTFVADRPLLWAFNKNLRGISISPRGPHLFHPGVLGWWTPSKIPAQPSANP